MKISLGVPWILDIKSHRHDCMTGTENFLSALLELVFIDAHVCHKIWPFTLERLVVVWRFLLYNSLLRPSAGTKSVCFGEVAIEFLSVLWAAHYKDFVLF